MSRYGDFVSVAEVWYKAEYMGGLSDDRTHYSTASHPARTSLLTIIPLQNAQTCVCVIVIC